MSDLAEPQGGGLSTDRLTGGDHQLVIEALGLGPTPEHEILAAYGKRLGAAAG